MFFEIVVVETQRVTTKYRVSAEDMENAIVLHQGGLSRQFEQTISTIDDHLSIDAAKSSAAPA